MLATVADFSFLHCRSIAPTGKKVTLGNNVSETNHTARAGKIIIDSINKGPVGYGGPCSMR